MGWQYVHCPLWRVAWGFLCKTRASLQARPGSAYREALVCEDGRSSTDESNILILRDISDTISLKQWLHFPVRGWGFILFVSLSAWGPRHHARLSQPKLALDLRKGSQPTPVIVVNTNLFTFTTCTPDEGTWHRIFSHRAPKGQFLYTT